MLRGNAPATIDDKGRLKIPTVFRAEIEVTWGSDFYVTSVTGDSVLVYPLPVWHEIRTKTRKTSFHEFRKEKISESYELLRSVNRNG